MHVYREEEGEQWRISFYASGVEGKRRLQLFIPNSIVGMILPM